MALDFTVKDVIHKVTAKFVHAFLTDAKKPCHLKAVFQPELDIHGIASKAEVYNIVTNLKVEGEAANQSAVGVFFVSSPERKKAKALAVNENRTLKVIAPADLAAGESYRLLIVTQSSARGSSNLLKSLREVQSDFALEAQT